MNGDVSKPIDPAALFETAERFVAARVPGPAVPAALDGARPRLLAHSTTRRTLLFVLGDRQSNLWVGTDAGLHKLQRDTGRVSRFLHDPENPRSLGHNAVGSILQDRRRVLSVGSELVGGLSALAVKSGDFTRYSFYSDQPRAMDVGGGVLDGAAHARSVTRSPPG